MLYLYALFPVLVAGGLYAIWLASQDLDNWGIGPDDDPEADVDKRLGPV